MKTMHTPTGLRAQSLICHCLLQHSVQQVGPALILTESAHATHATKSLGNYDNIHFTCWLMIDEGSTQSSMALCTVCMQSAVVYV